MALNKNRILDRVDDLRYSLRIFLGLSDHGLLHVIAHLHAFHVCCHRNDGMLLVIEEHLHLFHWRFVG